MRIRFSSDILDSNRSSCSWMKVTKRGLLILCKPDFPSYVHDPVRSRFCLGHRCLNHVFRRHIEEADIVSILFRKPDMALAIKSEVSWCRAPRENWEILEGWR